MAKININLTNNKVGSWWPAIALLLVVLVFVAFFIAANYYNKSNSNYSYNDVNNDSDNSDSDGGLSEIDLQEEACLDLGCEEGSVYIGSVNSNKYYSCSCAWGKSISEENRVCFSSDESALEDGRVKSEC